MKQQMLKILINVWMFWNVIGIGMALLSQISMASAIGGFVISTGITMTNIFHVLHTKE